MDSNTPNIYFFKALDAYRYELEKAIVALNHAKHFGLNNHFTKYVTMN
jgi:hypothetical protein